MDINERIKLTRQTLEALVDIRDGAAANKQAEIMIESGTTDEWDAITIQSVDGCHGSFFLRLSPRNVGTSTLTPEDIPPGSAFRHAEWPPFAYLNGYPAHDGTGIMLCDNSFVNWKTAREWWYIKRPSDQEWQSCSK